MPTDQIDGPFVGPSMVNFARADLAKHLVVDPGAGPEQSRVGRAGLGTLDGVPGGIRVYTGEHFRSLKGGSAVNSKSVSAAAFFGNQPRAFRTGGSVVFGEPGLGPAQAPGAQARGAASPRQVYLMEPWGRRASRSRALSFRLLHLFPIRAWLNAGGPTWASKLNFDNARCHQGGKTRRMVGAALQEVPRDKVLYQQQERRERTRKVGPWRDLETS